MDVSELINSCDVKSKVTSDGSKAFWVAVVTIAFVSKLLGCVSVASSFQQLSR